MVDQEKLKTFFKNKNILVTGGTGSIGQNIVSSLLEYDPQKIIIFSKDDSKQYLMKQKYIQHKNVYFHLGDIREYDSVEYVTKGIDLVFHVAALKQVPVCEEHPFEAVKTNVVGSENLIKACINNKVKKVVNISTDKAVNPTNTMGATKLIAEKLFKNANFMINNHLTKFCTVRFGNVLNSRGSVIPLFIDQAKDGEALTVTDSRMTRFIMTISDAAKLTINSAYYSMGGEIFIFKMNAVNILTLAETIKKFFEKNGSQALTIKQIGIRPGEKLYEELLHSNEVEHIVEDDELLVILPDDVHGFYHFKNNTKPIFRSDQVKVLDENELVNLLVKINNGIL